MATVEVLFETPDQIKEKMLDFERLFRNRYSEKDPWYARTCQREDRWFHVPSIQPWPPSLRRRGRGRGRGYDDRRRRGEYRRDRERGRGWHDGPGLPPPWHHGRRSPRPDYHDTRDYHDGRPPPHYRGHYGHEEGSPHPPSPSAGRHLSASPPPSTGMRHHSRSPWQHDGSPPPNQPSRNMYLQWGSGHDGEAPHEGKCSKDSEAPPFSLTQLPSVPPTPCEFQPHPLPHPQPHPLEPQETKMPSPLEKEPVLDKQEEKRKNRPPPLNLEEVAGLEEELEKVVPTKSDVLDILNTASFGSNAVNSDNLKQVKKETQAHVTKKHSRPPLSHPPPLTKRSSAPHRLTAGSDPFEGAQTPTTPTKMVITHGRPHDVPKPAKKSKHHSEKHSEMGVALDTITSVAMETTKVKGHKKSSKVDVKRPVKVAKHSAKNILLSEHSTGSMVGASKVVGIKKEGMSIKRSRGVLSDSSSEDENVDVTTPIDFEPLNVSLQRSLLPHNAIDPSERSSTQLTQFDTRNSSSASAKRHHFSQPTTLKVSINRGALHQTHFSRISETPHQITPSIADHSETSFYQQPESHELPTPTSAEFPNPPDAYSIEYDGGSNKMVIRSGAVEGVALMEAAPKKKKKKEKKKKSKHAKKKSRSDSFSHEVEGESEQKVTYLQDPLKLKIKFSG